MNDGRISFSCFSFKVLVLLVLNHCHTVMVYWHFKYTELLLMVLVTPVLFPKWQVYVSVCFQNLTGNSFRQIYLDWMEREPAFRGFVLTLLLSSPPLWCSGVLLSDDGLAFSLLLLESLSLMMSYCRQNRAITAARMWERGTHTH